MMRWPAEWEPHEAVWIGFPGNPAEWPERLAEAQREVAAFANAVWDDGAGERIMLVCRDRHDADIAKALVDDQVQIVNEPFGDIWLRDTGPIITVDGDKQLAHRFGFNGWGGKFEMAGDQDIGLRLAKSVDIPTCDHAMVLEGGAIDGDGQGALVTTRQCVLNDNRNTGLTKARFAENMCPLQIERICWLGDGLLADHTDGHVDNLARFVGPDRVAIPQAADADDPNADIFEDAAQRAQSAGLDVVRVPSVGKYEIDGAIAPASYMNFYIGNAVVAVPQYGVDNDSRAVREIAALFPDRKAVGLSSAALLRGGGSFHCISQQLPEV
ncbi:agmatine deiminase family protein [Parasphingorhabdus sp. JC815]|uniref:agmatine deiminase family protein n=1 Tax=Parasphingorhabdus sp. JC815 TaxID=3232140 RepID=UPI00345A1A67